MDAHGSIQCGIPLFYCNDLGCSFLGVDKEHSLVYYALKSTKEPRMIVKFGDGRYGVTVDQKTFISLKGKYWTTPEFVYDFCHLNFKTAQEVHWKYIGDIGIAVCNICGELLR